MIEANEEVKRRRMLDNLLDDMRELIPYLEDDTVTDLAVVDSGELIVTRFAKGREFTGIKIPTYITERIIKGTATINDKNIDVFSGFPILEGTIPQYNARITGLMPPNCCRAELQIRKPAKRIFTLEEYVKNDTINEEQYKQIVETIQNRGNIIVSGATGTGKTTFANAVLKKMTEFTPNDNFYIIEDTPELQCDARMKTMLWVKKEHAARAVEEALRFSPDRIIFGEVRSEVVMRELMDAWRTGHNGNMTTFHAGNGITTLKRIKRMLGAAGEEFSEDISEVISLIVHLSRKKNVIKVDELFNVSEQTDNFLAGIIQSNFD